MSRGVIYILINPAFTNLLKIGKTTRTAEERAAELSAGTGIPTKFEVAYEDFVVDCSLAERKIFEALKEYRYGKNREFFALKLKDAIPVVMDVICKINDKHSAEKIEYLEAAKPEKKLIEPPKEFERSALSVSNCLVLKDAKALTSALPITVRGNGFGSRPLFTLLHKNGLKIDNKRIYWEKRSYSLAKISTVYVASVFTGSISADSETYFLVMEPHHKRFLPEAQNFDFIQNPEQVLIMEAFRILTATTSGSNHKLL